ncbi:Similar to hypothetical protein MYCGRDRAFT_110449 [Mycosphaerella graminicola IPO323]; acc. no. EGP85368 [Pyronema omphalodes CBS 100304]|uniref:Uncharacterized protein n=1 Tax=Pyronema omphalodes (strain CBS 100304) TaxID=1076935 RepID=U4KWG6_PYROM|nr:Similar to hypothetical protein MYCGRDRAFT_110449 [Mycosphaerella graminicola IPO323]; acc. no. EGP85368 [Pyronema omphalodes CBS 100304]
MSGTTPWLSSYSLATDYEERRAEYAIAEEHSLLTPSATSHTYYAASSEKPLPRINYGWRNHLASLGWRPKTLMPGFLLGFAMISVVILLTLEFMLRRSKKFGAIVFVSEETKFIDYCFTYGPQLFAILYSLLFGSIDHDLKRLEAFFQLSCRDGATAEDSLFLSYHYKMACFVPFFAFRHRRNSRHFAVLCSSCALVLCLLVVTPAAGTMFSKELNITRIEETTFRHITPQEGAMMWGEAGYSSWDTSTTAFAYKAYSQRYSQGLPTPFTGESYALFPFVPTDSRTRIENEEWVTRTTLVAAELDCLPGIVQSKQDPEDAMPGLNITQITSIHHRCAFYLPPELGSAFWTYTSFMIDIDFLQRYKKAYPKHKIRIDCPGKDQLLIGFWGRTKPPSPATTDPWGSGLPNYEKATAVFCKPKHYRHQVDVTVDSFGQVMRAPLFTTPRATFGLWES